MLGTKNFSEEYILGQLYGQALAGEGLPRHLQGELRLSELADTAITSGKINFYPEYTGIIVARPREGRTPEDARRRPTRPRRSSRQTRGLTLLNPTPFSDTDSFSVLTSTAHKDGLKTMSDLKKVKSVHVRRAIRSARRGSPACSG